MQIRKSVLWLALSASVVLSACQTDRSESQTSQVASASSLTGMLPDGARWRAEIPANWNGTLLLYGHGYKPVMTDPDVAPRNSEAVLLAAGYALVASQYPTAGWSVEQAVPSQLLALDAFISARQKPDKVIAWGSSMGGLVTAALAQQHAENIDGAMTLCASAYGALPMMNMALDGAFVIATLIAPDMDFSAVGRGDNVEQVALLMERVASARQTPLGRARVMLAGVLAGIPDWTQPSLTGQPVQEPDDIEEQIAAALLRGVFLPRGDQEQRAGGVFSWNEGIDYHALLQASGRMKQVSDLYHRANESLQEDLQTLQQAPRIQGDAAAITYMNRHFTPDGRVSVPVLNVHTIGDGMTSPALQFAYTQLIQHRSGKAMSKSYWVNRAGHCTQTADELLVMLSVLEKRLESGQWENESDVLLHNSDAVRFTHYNAFSVPRACSENTWQCAQPEQ